jgi:hypothetical protein
LETVFNSNSQVITGKSDDPASLPSCSPMSGYCGTSTRYSVLNRNFIQWMAMMLCLYLWTAEPWQESEVVILWSRDNLNFASTAKLYKIPSADSTEFSYVKVHTQFLSWSHACTSSKSLSRNPFSNAIYLILNSSLCLDLWCPWSFNIFLGSFCLCRSFVLCCLSVLLWIHITCPQIVQQEIKTPQTRAER